MNNNNNTTPTIKKKGNKGLYGDLADLKLGGLKGDWGWSSPSIRGPTNCRLPPNSAPGSPLQ